jgi:hypothetical protein
MNTTPTDQSRRHRKDITMNAKTLADLFYTAEDGKLCIKNDEPDTETVKAMVLAADESGLGWDFAYDAVCRCLQLLADTDSAPDDCNTDDLADDWTSDLVDWLARSAGKHTNLCDEEREDTYLPHDTGMEERIRAGQIRGYRFAMNAIADNWTDDDEDEDES